jgi:hypothetical protein
MEHRGTDIMYQTYSEKNVIFFTNIKTDIMMLQSWLLRSTRLIAQMHLRDTGIGTIVKYYTVHGCPPRAWKNSYFLLCITYSTCTCHTHTYV